jgi:hypothetical protein
MRSISTLRSSGFRLVAFRDTTAPFIRSVSAGAMYVDRLRINQLRRLISREGRAARG